MAAYRDANSTAPAHGAVALAESDSANFPVTRSIYVGATGNLVVRMADGMNATFNAVPVGIFPIQIDMLYTTTTAGDIVGLY